TSHSYFFFLRHPPPSHIFTLSLHDALPIFRRHRRDEWRHLSKAATHAGPSVPQRARLSERKQHGRLKTARVRQFPAPRDESLLRPKPQGSDQPTTLRGCVSISLAGHFQCNTHPDCIACYPPFL